MLFTKKLFLFFIVFIALSGSERMNNKSVDKNFLKKYIPGNIDASQIKTIERISSKDDEYIATMNDGSKVSVTKFWRRQEIYCAHMLLNGTEHILNDKCFDIVENKFLESQQKITPEMLWPSFFSRS